jgi:hypothetical protein
MNNEYMNVNEIIELTSLSHKQIRNNINNLKKSNNINQLIIGGGKGKGGQFWFHFSLLPFISIRQRRKLKKDTQTTIKFRKLSELYYMKSSWNYFGCIHPNRDLDLVELTNSLKSFNSFYVIHRKNEINHIHFTIQSSQQKDEIKDLLKSYFKKRNISISEVFLTGFDTGFKDDTINYLLRKGKHSSKRDLVDWGLVFQQFQLF